MPILICSHQPPAVGTDPKAMLTVLKDLGNRGVKAGAVSGIKHRHPYTVESRESVPGTDPKISVVRLRDAANGALRQPVLNIPLPDDILSAQMNTRGEQKK
jgi:hypothetical protein